MFLNKVLKMCYLIIEFTTYDNFIFLFSVMSLFKLYADDRFSKH